VNQIIGINNKEFNTLHILANMDVFRDESIPLDQKQSYLDGVAARMNNNYENIAFYDREGNAITADGRTINFGTRPYFTEAFAGKDYVSDPALSKVTNTVLQHYSVPVYNDSNEPAGAIVLVINGNSLLEMVKATDLGEGMHPSVINRETQGNIATGNDGLDQTAMVLEPGSDLESIIIDVCEGNTAQRDFYEPAIKKHLIAAYQPVPDTTWSVFAVAPYDMYYSKISHMRYTIIGAMIISIIICIILCGIFVKIVFRPLGTVKTSIESIATGNADLTQRIPVSSNDEIGDVVVGFNQFIEKLQTIVKNLQASQNRLTSIDDELQNSTYDASASITEIISNIQSVNNQILSQAQTVQETVESINKVTQTVNNLENMIESQSNSVQQASSAVEEMIGNINSVNSAVGKMVTSFEVLEVNSNSGIARQNEVTKMIAEIEDQSISLEEANKAIASIAAETNLLAMNAAIEAAHAGNSGKGFSVVADEIRKLSETSTGQSKKIGAELHKIKDTISRVVSTSSQTNSAFAAVTDNINETSQILSQIRGAMDEQQVGSKQIIDALQEMNDSTFEVKNASSTMAQENALIMSEVNKLQDATAVIKGSVTEMHAGAEKINETGAGLSNISGQVTESIRQIGDEIGLFKV